MHYCDLLEGMIRKDPDAFLEMTNRYGWAVYSVIRRKYPDQAAADKVYNKVMHGLYDMLSTSDSEDPLEALLCGFAENILPDEEEILPENLEFSEIPQSYGELAAAKPGRKVRRLWFWNMLCIVLLCFVIVLLSWFLVGLLMECGVLPYHDLGYSLVHSYIMQLLENR